MLYEKRRAPPAPLQLSNDAPAPTVTSARWVPPPTPPPKSPLPTPPVSPNTPSRVSSFHRHSIHQAVSSPLMDTSTTARRKTVALSNPASPAATFYSRQLPDTPEGPTYLERRYSTTHRKRSGKRRKALPKWGELPTTFLEDEDDTLAAVHPFARSAGPNLELLDDSDTVPASPTSYLSPMSPVSSYHSGPVASTSSMYGAGTSTSSLLRPTTPSCIGTYTSSAHIDARIADLESQLQMLRVHLAQSRPPPCERRPPVEPGRIRGVRSIPILRNFTKLGRSSKGS